VGPLLVYVLLVGDWLNGFEEGGGDGTSWEVLQR